MIDVACALIEKDGLVLAAQRSERMSLPLKWEFPGGKLDSNESAIACLKREIYEELGVEIVISAALPPSEWDYEKLSVRLYPFVCTMNGGRIFLTEHKAVRWLTPEELPALDWAEADGPVLSAYLNYLRAE